MPLNAGTRLGHYEILSSLGAGGMGEVYRAKDTKLGREVAIKLLLDEVSQDQERRARFEREARVLASLNHNNIATLHGFEQAGDIRFLVMELVEGETLADRIARGAVPVAEALALFVQIAYGLAAAHEKGVIHRDLKPANIKVGEDGHVKILDFGLARATSADPEASDPALSMSPTLTLAATQRGEILGTAAYMSPEQAKGKAVDHRTDVWAFGVCLFEALSGRRVFRGDDASELLAAVLALEPDWEQLPANLPPALRRLVERCLRKDPAQRLHDISDVRLELEEIDPAAPIHGSEDLSRTRGVRPLTWAAVAFGAIGSAALAWTVLFAADERPALRPSVHTSLDARSAVRTGLMIKPHDVSRDGSKLVFVRQDPNRGSLQGTNPASYVDSSLRLYLRDLGSEDLQPLAGTEGANQPVFSFDGDRVAFVRGSSLWAMPLTGGAARQIHDFRGHFIWDLTWTSDDRLVLLVAEQDIGGTADRVRLVWVPASGGEPRPFGSAELGSIGRLASVRGLRSLAGGDVTLTPVSQEGDVELLRLSPEGATDRVALPAGAKSASILPSGHLVWSTRSGTSDVLGAQLFAAPFDPERFALDGTAEVVLGGVQGNAGGYAWYAFSDDGLLVYPPARGSAAGLHRISALSPDGELEPLVPEWRLFHYPRVSPDGRTIAVTIHGEGEPHDLFLYDVGRGAPTPLTSTGNNIMSVWHPDGESLVYAKAKGGFRDHDLHLRRLGEEGDGRPLLVRDGQQLPWAWSPDGTALVFGEDGGESQADLWILEVGEEPRPLVDTKGNQTSAAVSPDGLWMLYESDEADGQHVYLRPFPGPGQARRVSESSAVEPLWSPGGDSIYTRDSAFQALLRVSFEVSPDGVPHFGPEEVVAAGSWGNYALGGASYAIAPDGRPVVLENRIERDEDSRMRVVVNWFDELERQVPTR
jgi:serine/threonine protein kinase